MNFGNFAQHQNHRESSPFAALQRIKDQGGSYQLIALAADRTNEVQTVSRSIKSKNE